MIYRSTIAHEKRSCLNEMSQFVMGNPCCVEQTKSEGWILNPRLTDLCAQI